MAPNSQERLNPASAVHGGLPVKEVYGRDDILGLPDESPGVFPFTRGIQPTMYRGRPWTMRQYAGMGDAEASNRRYRFLLANGTSGLSVAFDLPTQLGYDSDDPLALGEVGKVGVAIDSVEDMERLFAGIPLDRISTSMTINAPAAILLAFYVAVARRQGAAVPRLSGTIQNDILKEYIARGTYIFPIVHAMRLVTDVFGWAAEQMPAWNTISISGYHMREAGATAVQEVAFTLANAETYVQAALNAGLAVDAFAPRLSFFFSAHSDLFREIAKFRAARRMWAHIMRDRFHARDPKSWMMRIHTQTAGSTLTAQQPENNIVRTAIEALAGVLGGTQSLHANGFDEALSLPSERAAQIAVRTQQILAYESGAGHTADPLAGSYYVESLTSEIERRAELYLETVRGFDPSGGGMGMLRAVERGYVQREIQNAAYAHQRAIDSGEVVIVGVNAFVLDAEPPTPIQPIDESMEARQRARLKSVRSRRDGVRHEASLRSVREAASSGANLMPHLLEAAESLATLGEIAHTLRQVFGEYRETVVI